MNTILRKITILTLFLSILAHSLGGCCAFHHNHAVSHQGDKESKSCGCSHHQSPSSENSDDQDTSSFPSCCDHDAPCFLKTKIQEDGALKMPVLLVTGLDISEYGLLFVPDVVSVYLFDRNLLRESQLPLYLQNQALLI